MARIENPLSVGDLPNHTRALVLGRDPIEGMWLLAGAGAVPNYDAVRKSAEATLSRNVFTFGIGHRHLSADGRQEGQTPGAIGAGSVQREEALLGAMRFHANHGRLVAVYGIIEPGREQLLLQHDYTLREIHAAVRSRPFIPRGHETLWAKGIHAGLVGEYDVAVHLLAPQLENALREALRRRGEVVYTTASTGVQSMLSADAILKHPTSKLIFGEDIVFALETALAERLGANMRNLVAHGILDDDSSQSYDASFLWWLALRIVRFYATDALAPAAGSVDP